MANFKTHLSVASLASTAFAGAWFSLSIVEEADVPRLIILGAAGGLLPDVDADNSVPVRRIFNSLALLSGSLVLSRFAYVLSASDLAFLAIIASLIVRFPLFYLFRKTTRHRGVFHSLLGSLFFGLTTTCASHWFLGWDNLQSWYNGIFISFGFIIHLCLDELYSVNLSGLRMKKSFGTALKLYSYNDLVSSGLLLLMVIGLFSISPPLKGINDVLAQVEWDRFMFWNVKTAGL